MIGASGCGCLKLTINPAQKSPASYDLQGNNGMSKSSGTEHWHYWQSKEAGIMSGD
jgi:hypothetical protein